MFIELSGESAIIIRDFIVMYRDELIKFCEGKDNSDVTEIFEALGL